MTKQTLDITLEGGVSAPDLRVTSAVIVEAISRPTRATVLAVSTEDLDGDGSLGGPVCVVVRVDGEPVRRFHLVLVGFRCDGFYDGTKRRYALELAHELALLELRSDVRMFQEKTAKDIVAAVLDGAGVPAAHVRWSVQRTLDAYTYCVQYRETDFAFFSRLCEHEGVFYFIHDADDAAPVTFADAQAAFPPIDGDPDLQLIEHTMHGTGLHDFYLESVAVPEQVTICDYNFETPAVDLTNTKQATGSPAGGTFEYAAGFQKPSQGSTLAAIRMEEVLARRTTGHGRSDHLAMQSGTTFTLEDAGRDALAGDYVILSVEHRITPNPIPGDTSVPYENTFTCLPKATAYRPPRVTPKPRQGGAHVVVTTGPSGAEIHTDKHGRMKGHFFWDRVGKDDDTSSCWMRLGQLPIRGSMALARVGWEMSVVYLHGDLDRPLAISRLYNAEKTSPYGYPAAGSRMSLQTASSPASGKTNELRMEDGGGGMEMFVNASKDYDAVTNNNKTEKIGVDETRNVAVDEQVTIGANETASIGANLSTTVSANTGLQITGNRTKSVGGSETVTVGADHKSTVEGSDSETTGGSHTTLALLSVSRTSVGSHSLTVAGSMVSAAGLGVSVAVGGAKSETVGGAKISVSAASVTDSVTGAYAATVGGVRVQAAAGNRVASAKGSSVVTVGGLLVANAGKQLTIKGSTVSIKVGGVANFLGGGGILNMTPGSAAFVGLVTLDASGSITLSGNPNLVG